MIKTDRKPSRSFRVHVRRNLLRKFLVL